MTPSCEALQRRDSAAWDAFYREHVGEVYGFLFRLAAGDRQAADDLFQETWLEAIDAIEQYDPARGQLRAWLFGIARRRAALFWRRRLGRQQAAGDENWQHTADGSLLPDEAMQQLERGEAVQAALLLLSEDRKRALIDKYVEGLSVEEIAASSGKSPKSVESLLSRARDELRSLLSWHFSDMTRGERT
jgi:RNA polymerase sigma-70 factor, ECF subfamily